MPTTPTVISALPLENAVRDYLDRDDRIGLEQFLSILRAPDIADVVDRLPESQRDQLFTLLPPRLQSEVLAEAGEGTKRALLEDLPRERKRELLHYLPMDDVIRLLIAVPQQHDELLEEISPVVAPEVRRLLEYPKESAGRLMT